MPTDINIFSIRTEEYATAEGGNATVHHFDGEYLYEADDYMYGLNVDGQWYDISGVDPLTSGAAGKYAYNVIAHEDNLLVNGIDVREINPQAY